MKAQNLNVGDELTNEQTGDNHEVLRVYPDGDIRVSNGPMIELWTVEAVNEAFNDGRLTV